MAGLRLAITQNDLDGFAARFREEQAAGDIEPIGSSHG
jgi:hypothetical protein